MNPAYGFIGVSRSLNRKWGSRRMGSKIALGFGNNVDYEIVWDSRVFEDFILRYRIRGEELSTDRPIDSERDLVVSCLAFLKEGKGGERFAASPEIIEKFSNNFQKKVTLGGTPVRAMLAMHKMGAAPALHLVTVNDYIRQRIPKDCPYVCSSKADSLYPHLIVQFDRGTCVDAGGVHILSARSNRVIYSNDADNRDLKLSEHFSDLISDAEVLLISGFNTIRDGKILDERLDTLLSMLEKLPRRTLLFYEDACFYNADFSKRVRDVLSRRISIFSLNEDELQGTLNREIDLTNAAQVKQALAEVHDRIPVPVIVVHTRYWALAYGEKAGEMEKALKSGITTAAARFQFGDEYTAEDVKRTRMCPPEPEGEAFSREMNGLPGGKVCCLASLNVKAEKATTIGLGDSFVGGFLPALVSL